MNAITNRRLLVAALLIAVAGGAYAAFRWQSAERRAERTFQWTRFVMDSLGTTLNLPAPEEPWGRDSVYWKWVATSAQMQSRRWQKAVQHWAQARGSMLEDYDVARLQSLGLKDPVRQLRDSLDTHPELIPYDAVLGGHMFYDRAMILGPEYVFAEFEDGHINGAILLRYEVSADGHVAWKRVWSKLD